MFRLSFATLFLFLTGSAFAQPPSDPPPVVLPSRDETAHSLSRQYRELIPGLIDALKDLDAEVRQHSAMALAAIGPEAVGPLTQALKDTVRDRRAAAAYALGQMGHLAREAVPALLEALKDEEAAVRRASSQAISRIVNSDLGTSGFGVRSLTGMTPANRGGRGIGSAPSLSIPSSLPPIERPK